jgi:dephospho-CoA kinase
MTDQIIAAVGLAGSGKDTLVEFLCNHHDFQKLSTGDHLRNIARDQAIKPTRQNLRNLADDLIQEKGSRHLAEILIRQIKEEKMRRVAISGLRTPDDVAAFREMFGEAFRLVYVEVDEAQLRYERLLSRNATRDQQSYQDFLKNDQRENQAFRLQETCALADLIVPNNTDLENFHRQIEETLFSADA